MAGLPKRIGGGALAATVALGLSAQLSQAGYVVDLTQQGSNVVATGSGAIDLTDTTSVGIGLPQAAFLDPAISAIITGLTGSSDAYGAFITGPSNFGGGDSTNANSGSGGLVGIIYDDLYVPSGYVSDSPLSDTATYNNQTFSSLGLTPGTYEWTWGTGANQNFTLVIETPEPSTWALMLAGLRLPDVAKVRRCRQVASTNPMRARA